MDFQWEGTRRSVNLSAFLLPSLKAERCDFLGKNRSGARAFQNNLFTLVLLLLGTVTVNSKSFKITQKTTFDAKGRQNTAGKVIQRLFNIDSYTCLAIYRYR